MVRSLVEVIIKSTQLMYHISHIIYYHINIYMYIYTIIYILYHVYIYIYIPFRNHGHAMMKFTQVLRFHPKLAAAASLDEERAEQTTEAPEIQVEDEESRRHFQW